MSILESLFGSSVLELVIPDTSLEFPPNKPTDEWLANLKTGALERKQAFFDEQLQSILTVRITHPTPESPPDQDHPPHELLSLISHLQISLEATYISSTPTPSPGLGAPHTARLSAPPRGSHGRLGTPRLGVHHPSILPPSTPNPTPSTADGDRRYISSEGTLLVATIWGQNASEESREAFCLLWSARDQVWIAVYRLSVTVSFLRLNVADPLLCLTVSATLREKPLVVTGSNHPLNPILSELASDALPTSPVANGSDEDQRSSELNGLEEVNLLEGLAAGPTFALSTPSLPSSRLGAVTRQKLFSLAPVVPSTSPLPSPSPLTAVRTSHPTLRKSFRKTLRTVSGFRVRMRTVFVPYVFLPETHTYVHGKDPDDDDEDEREKREAGNEERTVVLCVEVENSGESGPGVGFAVESVDVAIGGDGAKATLIGWGDEVFGKGAEEGAFPLLVGSKAQYNLLYAVSFLRPPEEVDGFSVGRDANSNSNTSGLSSSDLQRAVTINIYGKPFVVLRGEETEGTDILHTPSPSVTYPTNTFSSRWNCILDLSAHQAHPAGMEDDGGDGGDGYGYPSALPEPPSPFPSVSPRTSMAPGFPGFPGNANGVQPEAVAGSKRHTIPGGTGIVAARSIKSATTARQRASTPILKQRRENREHPPLPVPLPLPQHTTTPPTNINSKANTPSRLYTPPSVFASAHMPRSPTTYGPPPGISMSMYDDDEPGASGSVSYTHDQTQLQTHTQVPPMPMTPAYPAYPSNSIVPPTPMFQTPLSMGKGGVVGPSVEIRRERGLGVGGMGVGGSPQTPAPVVMGAGGFAEMQELRADDGSGSSHPGESIVVSVGLVIPSASGGRKDKDKLDENGKGSGSGKVSSSSGRLCPLDCFTLDIFVFNQSAWTRRFEVSCPDRRKRRHGHVQEPEQGQGEQKYGYKYKSSDAGVLPLDNRVRIGPLRPATCQSVRMEFLAVTPGVHTIDTLTLTDVETGFSMNLRSVMDVVVHEP